MDNKPHRNELRIKLIAPERGTDSWGSGRFGAPRGTRLHIGIDFAAHPGSVLLSPVGGRVSKLGYPYGDDLSYRYVQVTDSDGLRHRFFYVSPEVEVGDAIVIGSRLGEVQDIVARYPIPKGMKPHVHYEIKDDNNIVVPPGEIWDSKT